MRADTDSTDLIRQAAAGDAGAWRQIVASCGPRVFALIYRQCGDRDLAEELTQATFVTVVEKFDSKYREQGRFEPWLFRIAMNRLRDEMRRRKRQAVPINQAMLVHVRDESAPQVLERLSRDEQIERLRISVAELPEADREVLHLRHTAGLSFAQIAETLGQPLGTVLARAHRALKKLREKLGGSEAGQDGQDR